MPSDVDYPPRGVTVRPRGTPDTRRQPNPGPRPRSKTLVAVFNPPGGSAVHRSSPLARAVQPEEDSDSSSDDEESNAQIPSHEELEDGQRSSDGVEEGDLPESQSSQFDLETVDETTGFLVPTNQPNRPSTNLDIINTYLLSDEPIVVVLILSNEDAVRMYRACKAEGHKLRVKFLPCGIAAAFYSRSSDVYQEVASYTRIRALSATERRMSNLAATFSWASRLSIPVLGTQFWATVLSAAFISTCIVTASLCLAFDACLDVVGAPEKAIRLIANVALLFLGCLIHAAKLVSDAVSTIVITVAHLAIENAILLNKRAHDGAQTLIRTAIIFLEALLSNEM